MTTFDYAPGVTLQCALTDAEAREVQATADADKAFADLLPFVAAASKAGESNAQIAKGIGVSGPTVAQYLLTYRAVKKYAPAVEDQRPIKAAIVKALRRDDMSNPRVSLLIRESATLADFLKALRGSGATTKVVAEKAAEVLMANVAAIALKALDAPIKDRAALITALDEITRVIAVLRVDGEDSPGESTTSQVEQTEDQEVAA